ncbi:MAG: hypothetical protein ACPLSK_05550 [bacterium]
MWGKERTEFEKAIEKLLNEYDTADWENRFVVGGAMEVLFCALVNSLGFSSKWLKETRYDVEIEKVKFSLKSNFKGGGDIRLINVLGEESVSWAEPTIFFISELGICYADPSMGLQTRRTSDALVINTKEIKALVEENDEWLIRVKIPLKAGKRGKLRTASYSVAKAILDEIESKHLLNGLSKLAISGEERND